MTVNKVDPECATGCGPPHSFFHRASVITRYQREVDSVGPGLIQGVGVGVSQVDSGHPVMDLPMGIQGPCRQVRVALAASDPLAELFPVGVTLPRHPDSIGLHRVPPKSSAILTSNALCLGHISVKANVVKYLR